MATRRSSNNTDMDPTPSGSTSRSSTTANNRKQTIINQPNRVGTGYQYERKTDKPGFQTSLASQGKSVTISSLKTRLAPTIRSALSVAVDTLLGEVVLVLNETQHDMISKEQENERLKVRLEVSEREMRTLQECLSSAQKLIDQLQIPYSGSQTVNQSVFAPSVSSMGSMNPGMDRDHQQGVNGGMGMGGHMDDSLHGYDSRDDYKMCQLSIQPDGSVTNHSMESYTANQGSMCADPARPDGSRFEVKEEQAPGSGVGPGQPCRRVGATRADGRSGGGEPEQSAESVGELGHIHVVEEDAAGRSSLSYPLRHPRTTRPRATADGQKGVARPSATGRGESVSPGGGGGSEESAAGPSTANLAVSPDVDRPHHCLECGKTFRLISSLKKHIRIHTGEKPYPCSVCGRRFRESGALKTHLRIHTGEKPYSCSECGNSFRHLDGLRKHRRTHTGEKPYVCSICGKRLSRLQHLKHHQLIHTGERPCSCPFCHRSFKEPAALRKHVRTHRDEPGANLDGGLVAGGEEMDTDAMDDINNLHPAAPSPPQMRFGEWGPEGEDGSSVVDCV